MDIPTIIYILDEIKITKFVILI